MTGVQVVADAEASSDNNYEGGMAAAAATGSPVPGERILVLDDNKNALKVSWTAPPPQTHSSDVVGPPTTAAAATQPPRSPWWENEDPEATLLPIATAVPSPLQIVIITGGGGVGW